MIARALTAMGILLVLGAGSFVGVSAAGEVSGSFKIGNARFELGGTYMPDRAPAHRFVPIRLKTFMDVTTDDQVVPPRMDEIVVDLGNNIRFARRGLGRCDPQRIAFASTKGAKKRCRRALVGGGNVKAIVKLEDQEQFVAKGPLLIFNGVDGRGRPAVILHTLAAVPLPTTFVIVAKMERSPFRGYGQRLTVQIPEIAQGQGVMSSFRVNLKRKPRGKRFMVARCPRGSVKVKAAFDLHPEPPAYPNGRDFEVSMAGSCLTKRR